MSKPDDSDIPLDVKGSNENRVITLPDGWIIDLHALKPKAPQEGDFVWEQGKVSVYTRGRWVALGDPAPPAQTVDWDYVEVKSDGEKWNRDNPVDNMHYVVQPKDLPKLNKMLCFCCDKEVQDWKALNNTHLQRVELYIRCHNQADIKYFNYETWEKICTHGTWQAFL
jgi:hypothetical protein